MDSQEYKWCNVSVTLAVHSEHINWNFYDYIILSCILTFLGNLENDLNM